jgi:hypothetical protein
MGEERGGGCSQEGSSITCGFGFAIRRDIHGVILGYSITAVYCSVEP